MKPISVKLPEDYSSAITRVRAELNQFNPTGRSVSSCHVLRYSLRIAAGEPRNQVTADKVLLSDDSRGKRKSSK